MKFALVQGFKKNDPIDPRDFSEKKIKWSDEFVLDTQKDVYSNVERIIDGFSNNPIKLQANLLCEADNYQSSIIVKTFLEMEESITDDVRLYVKSKY
jgi:hypothetical protein